VGGWSGLKANLPPAFVHAWTGMGSPHNNPLGVEWFSLVMGLGFVLFGYWCTDFLVVQRAMAADSMNAARRTPLIAAVPKMFFPFLVILSGLIALAITGPSRIRRRPPVTAHIPQPSNMRTAPRGGFLWSLVEGLGLTPLVPGRLPAAKSIRAPWSL
jgi:solute:Na+ symporter, SSS family